MGLESYLFQIRFKIPLHEADTIAVVEQAGMIYLKHKSNKQTKHDFGNHYFEIRSGKGLSEANIVLSPNNATVDEFSLRFSILSPPTVIDQTFEFLKRLNELCSIQVYDTEIRNHIMRQLRQTGKVDNNFEGLNDKEDEVIEKLCIVSLNSKDFHRNELEIIKRQRILNNVGGQIIEGGDATINYIERKGLFEKFFSWFKNNYDN